MSRYALYHQKSRPQRDGISLPRYHPCSPRRSGGRSCALYRCATAGPTGLFRPGAPGRVRGARAAGFHLPPALWGRAKCPYYSLSQRSFPKAMKNVSMCGTGCQGHQSYLSHRCVAGNAYGVDHQSKKERANPEVPSLLTFANLRRCPLRGTTTISCFLAPMRCCRRRCSCQDCPSHAG